MIWGRPEAWGGLVLLIPLLILHRHRLRRKERLVSSLILWDFPGTQPASSRKKRLKENFHLLLQTLIIILLSAALADPQIPRTFGAGKNRQIIVLDGSASMSAGEGRDQRFNQALKEVRRLIRQQGLFGETAIILAGAEPVLLSDFTSSARQLRTALKEARVWAVETEEESALTLAFQLSRGADTDIVIVSDGGFSPPPEESSLSWSYRLVGKPADNLGITAFNGRQDQTNPNKHHLFAAVFNGTDFEQRTNLSLLLNGEVKEKREVILPPGKEISFLFTLETAGGEVQLKLEDPDGLDWDNTAYLLVNNHAPANILLVTPGNHYLEKLLRLMPGVKLSKAEQLPPVPGFDVIIFDSPPPDPLPPGNYLFLAHPPSFFPVDAAEPVFFPGALRWDSEHPVMEEINPRSFSVYRTAGFITRKPALSILEGRQPLISVFEDNLTRAVFVNFTLHATDLVLRTDFPLLMANMIGWLHRDPVAPVYNSLRGGQWITQDRLSPEERLRIAADGSLDARLTRPDGTEEGLFFTNGVFRFLAAEPGFYRLTTGLEKREWAVNLLSSDESNLLMRDSLPANDSFPDSGADAPEERGLLPLWPWLLIPAVVLTLFERLMARKGLTGAGKRGRIEMILTAAALSFMAGAAVDPVVPLGGRGLSLVYLVDVSQSITPGAREAALSWVEASARNGNNLDATAVVVFGSDALIASPPAPVFRNFRIETWPDGTETNPTAAVQRALSLLPSRGDRRIILLSDGGENKGDLKRTLSALADPGLILHTVALSGGISETEVLLKNITAPAAVSPIEKFPLTLEVESLTDTRARLFFYLDGDYFGEDELILSKGTTPLLYQLNLEDSGFHLMEVMIQPDVDGRHENNRLQRVIFVQGDAPLLYIHGPQGESQSLLRLLDQQGYKVVIKGGADFPGSLTELFSFRAVILDNLSAFELSLSEMEMLRKAAAAGLGVLALGGDSSFGLGGYYKTPLETLLPVDVDITSSMDMPEMAMVMLIDKSGTMQEQAGDDDQGQNRQKIDLAKQAVLAAVEVLKPGYEAGILSFDAAFQWTIPLTDAGDIDTIREGLFPLSPGGGTALYPALQEAHRVLSGHSASVKHILILSDGHTVQDDFDSLVEEIWKDGITISTVALGERADRDFMENLAKRGHGRSYYAEEIEKVPTIFAGESLKASKRLAVEETFFPRINKGHPVLQGVESSGIPPLRGFLLSYPKEEAEILLEGPEGHPLLAVRQYGLGRTAAFTSSLDSPWSEPWIGWEGRDRIFAQLIRHINRGRGYEGISFGLIRHGREGEIAVNAQDPEGGYLDHLNLAARVIGPDMKEELIPLDQTGPGRYRGYFPLHREGSYFVTLTRNEDPRMITTTAGKEPSTPRAAPESAVETYGTAVISLPYPDEYQRLSSDAVFLKEVAALTGGKLLSLSQPLEPDFFIPDPDLPSHPLHLRPGLILVSLLLFFTALVFRLITWGELARPIKKIYHRIIPSREPSNAEPTDVVKNHRNNDYWFGSSDQLKEKKDREET